MRRINLTVLLLLFLAACNTPRGAPIQSEVLNESSKEAPTFSVVPVTRASLVEIAKWPVTGWKGFYYWIGEHRGPASPIIRGGDQVDLVVWDSQENSLIASPEQRLVKMDGLLVSASGTIFVPYIGEVLVTGLTPSQARERIQKDLEKVVPQAQVQLSVSPGDNNTADLVGGVAKPGRIPLSGRNVTLLSLIAEGGGIRNDLKNPLIRMIRAGKTYEIRAEDLFADSNKNLVMRSGDKVIIEEDKRYFVALGATGREQLVYFDKEHITALEALSMLGGLSDTRANPQGVLVLREYGPKQTAAHIQHGPELPQVVFTFDLTGADGLFAARSFQINPNDTVVATESPINATRTIVGLLGSVFGIARQINDL